jgi:hypothetical protein
MFPPVQRVGQVAVAQVGLQQKQMQAVLGQAGKVLLAVQVAQMQQQQQILVEVAVAVRVLLVQIPHHRA